MHRPPMGSAYDSPARHHHAPSGPSASTHPSHAAAYEPASPGRSAHPGDGSRRDYDQLPPVHGVQHRASHLHLPSVATYIEHYHYYNFNGNCTVQQASSDGQPNTIQMVSSSVRQAGQQQPGPRVDIPPVPPPMREPLSRTRNGAHGAPGYGSYAAEPSAPVDHDKRPSASAPAVYSTLPISHLPSMPGPSRGGLGGPPSGTLPRQSPFLPSSRLGKPPVSGADHPRMMHGGQSALLPRLRGALDPGGPISLAPLQSSSIPTMSPLHGEEGKLGPGRPTKRSRLARNVSIPMSGHDLARGGPSGLPGGGGGSESNCASVSEDRGMHGPHGGRGGAMPQKGFGMERMVPTTNSSSPSHGEYPLPAGRNEGIERNSSAPGLRATRNVDESQSNDWEAVVEMYTTGKGTEDGVALKMITKGDGRRVSDRKLLEKRRTIGKTYECLGADRFEAAIGYKWENGVRRKQKMYHVISRCRVVNAMRKAGEAIPLDFGKLTALIDERIAEKEALKEAGKSGLGGPGGGAGGSGAGARPAGSGYSVEGAGRMVSRAAGGNRDVQNSPGEGEGGVEGGGGGGRGGGGGGLGRLVRSGSGGVGGHRGLPDVSGEDEIERGRVHERGRFG